MQSTHFDGDLVVAVEDIRAERSRGEQPSDGGGTGRSDTNDGIR
ncbi:hypothetical protein [Nocardiopsis sp. YSL2]|nr:hypothetical protein [Nocardiopsis sp. YSL2]